MLEEVNIALWTTADNLRAANVMQMTLMLPIQSSRTQGDAA